MPHKQVATKPKGHYHGTTGPRIMTDDDKLKLRPLGAAPMRRPGEPLPEPLPEELVPELRGETTKLNFKVDVAVVDAINRHVDRLHRMSPFIVTTASDAVRSLIMEGARSYAAKFSEPSTNEPKK